MGLFARRPRLPEEIMIRLVLRDRERVHRHAATASGGHLVASDRALHVVPAARPDGTRPDGWRVPWEDVASARWDEPVLLINPVPGVPVPPLRATLEQGRDLAREVEVRVDATVNWYAEHALTAARGRVRVVARRLPDGSLRFDALPGDGVDLDAPGVAAEVSGLLDAARRQVGAPS